MIYRVKLKGCWSVSCPPSAYALFTESRNCWLVGCALVAIQWCCYCASTSTHSLHLQLIETNIIYHSLRCWVLLTTDCISMILLNWRAHGWWNPVEFVELTQTHITELINSMPLTSLTNFGNCSFSSVTSIIPHLLGNFGNFQHHWNLWNFCKFVAPKPVPKVPKLKTRHYDGSSACLGLV